MTFAQQTDADFHSVTVVDPKTKTNSSFTVPRRFKNLQIIKSGRQFIVVSADEYTTGARIAIKKGKRPIVKLESAKRAFLHLKASLNHPNIVQTHSVFTPQVNNNDSQEVYLVTELMKHDLSEVIEKVFLDHRTLSFFIYQILCAVNHLHREGVVHKDLKPSSIAVNDKCQVKLLDFGFAQSLGAQAGEQITGNEYYRAPELVLGLACSEKSDIWSIGCIFAELITGHVLFPGKDRVRQWNKIVEIMGTPATNLISQLNEDIAKRMRSLPQIAPKSLDEVIPFHSIAEDPTKHWTALDARRLISKMLAIDPSERCTADEALRDPYVRCWYREEEVNAPLSRSIIFNEDHEETLESQHR